MHDAHILILAAGTARRIGGEGGPTAPAMEQIARITRTALASGAPVTVVMPPERRAALPATRARVVVAPFTGMRLAQHLGVGLDALPPGAPTMLLLADMPDITTEDLRQMLGAWRATPQLILRAMDDEGRPAHPTCFPAWARPDLAALRPDDDPETLLRRQAGRMRLFALGNRHDIDDPQIAKGWRAAHPRPATTHSSHAR